MIEKEIKMIFEEFNYMADNLIKSFNRTNLDEDSLVFLSKRTKYLLSFTHLILLKVVSSFYLPHIPLQYNSDFS